jgi:CheY-like chemotaxis protein
MQGKTKARWLTLCEQAAVEQDPAKLHELVNEIHELLSQKQQRLEQRKPTNVADPIVASTTFANRILLADDSRIVRRTLKNFLVQKSPAWEISEAESGQEAVKKVVTSQPALVVLDLNLPDVPGQEAARQIRQLSPATKIIICSLNDSAHLEAIAKHVGAEGYITKTSSPNDFHKTIAAVLKQALTLPPSPASGNSAVQ